VIDTLPAPGAPAGLVPGAVNACVHEVAFLDKVAALAPGPDEPIVLYDTSDRSHGALFAAEKLARAGYRDVRVLSGGLDAWTAAGLALAPPAEPATAEPAARNGVYVVDPSRSRLEWTGRNLNGRHVGTVRVAAGHVRWEDGVVIDGEVTLDLAAMTNLDVADAGHRAQLIRHLQSDDFFDVASHGLARYVIRGSESLVGTKPGSPGHLIRGELHLRGVARDLDLPAQVASAGPDGLRAQVTIELDRTLWGVIYGSGRFFERLGMHLVNDLVGIEAYVVAERGEPPVR
jgi:polyisoprenoid-binding protein YceI